MNLFSLSIQYPFLNFIIYLYTINILIHESDHCQQNVSISSFRNMQLYKQKIAAAKKGHELLKRKADALKKKFK